MDPLPPIPTPIGVLWREFRLRVLPVVMFSALAVAVALIWPQVNRSGAFSGLGEGVRSIVTSPQSGLVRELQVRPYQLVNQGDPIAVIVPQDPRLPLDLLQAELQLARMRFEPSLAEQNAMNYERIRAELLRYRAELAIAKVNLERAQNEVQRNTPLYHEKLVSEDIYDLSLKTRDAFKAEVEEKTKAVRDMEGRMAELRSLGEPAAAVANERQVALLDRLSSAQSLAASNWGPMVLVAPISGMVSAIYRQPGEHAVEGEALLSIYALWSDRVVGYLRQPYPFDPEPGLPVQVTTRTQKRQQFWAEITQVGAQVEMITNVLAFIRQGALVDVGLPVMVELPDEARIRPGEMVDLWIRPRSGRSEGTLGN